MDVLKELINSPILYVVTILIVVILLRKGLLQIHTGNFSLGRTRDNERRILSSQINYVTLEIDAIASEMVLKLPEINKYHTKYVLEKVLDEFVRRIACNHIIDDKAFIEDVNLTVLAIVRKRCQNEYFWNEEFEKYCYAKTENIIKRIYDIRKRLSK